MKIAVASTGNSINSTVDVHTGRARCFILYDTDDEDFEVYDNWRILECQHWAGSRSAGVLIDLNVDVVLLRHIGPCAFRRLTDARIGLYLVPEDCRAVEAIRLFRDKQLTPLKEPNCSGHQHLSQ